MGGKSFGGVADARMPAFEQQRPAAVDPLRPFSHIVMKVRFSAIGDGQ